MSLALSVTDRHADGVRLISSDTPGFDDLARPLMGERVAGMGLQMKPMLAIVANDSPQTIVSLSLVWRITDHGGVTSTIWQHASFPETVCGDILVSQQPDALPPDGRRLEAPEVVLHGYGYNDEYYDQFLGQFVERKNELLADAVALHLDLNAVIFADGTLVGSDDDGKLADLFAHYVGAKQAWYGGILDGLEAGQSVDEAFSGVRAFQAELTREMQTGRMPSHFSDPHAIWRQQAAAEAASWRRKFSDDQIPGLLRHAIRRTPFLVHRSRQFLR
jgi:hypothetical protein